MPNAAESAASRKLTPGASAALGGQTAAIHGLPTQPVTPVSSADRWACCLSTIGRVTQHRMFLFGMGEVSPCMDYVDRPEEAANSKKQRDDRSQVNDVVNRRRDRCPRVKKHSAGQKTAVSSRPIPAVTVCLVGGSLLQVTERYSVAVG